MDKKKVTIKYNRNDDQALNSVTCGYFCSYVLDQFIKGRSLNSIIYDFGRRRKNEKKIRDYAKSKNIKGGSLIKRALKAYNFYKNPSALLESPDNEPTDRFSDWLKSQDANSQIVDLHLGRKPIVSGIRKALNALSFGGFNKVAKKLGYDDVYHNYIVATIKEPNGQYKNFKLEKNQTVTKQPMRTSDFDAKLTKIDLKGKKLTAKELIEKAQHRDPNFWVYDGATQNCQKFTKDIIEGNNLGVSDEAKKDDLKPQNTVELIDSLGVFKHVPRLITNIAGNISQVTNVGAGVKKQKLKAIGMKPTTKQPNPNTSVLEWIRTNVK